MSFVSPLVVAGHEVWPLVEGGKGVADSNRHSAGARAAAGGQPTFSTGNPHVHDPNCDNMPQVLKGPDSRERHQEQIE
jgi:hypothetical protein